MKDSPSKEFLTNILSLNQSPEKMSDEDIEVIEAEDDLLMKDLS